MRDRKPNFSPRLYGRYILLAALFFLFFYAIFKIVANNRWDGNRRFTVLFHNLPKKDGSLDTANIGMLSVEPRGERAAYFYIPFNTFLDVPFGYKNYLAASVYGLGELDEKRKGAELLARSLETTFAVAVDSYMIASNDFFLQFPESYENLKKIKSSIPFFGGVIFFPKIKIMTNLSFLDRFRLWNTIRKLRLDQIEYINLENNKSLREESLPDGTKVKMVDKDMFDFTVGDNFFDSFVRKEQISIEIVNAADEERLATEVSRVIKLLGGNVISRLTAKNTQSASCTLYFANPKAKSGIIVERLKKHYRCQISNESIDTARSDIKVILGKDFVK